jgi:F-type H+-transporting ATPase subunit b
LIFDEKFWIACSFILFILSVFKILKGIVIKFLDSRIGKVQAKLEEAEKLRKEAEEVLAAYNLMHQKVLNESKEIAANAEQRLSSIIKEMEAQLDKSIERRRAVSLQKIASYEAEILKDMREQAVNIAIAVVQKMLKERLNSKASDPQFNEALAEVDKKLH